MQLNMPKTLRHYVSFRISSSWDLNQLLKIPSRLSSSWRINEAYEEAKVLWYILGSSMNYCTVCTRSAGLMCRETFRICFDFENSKWNYRAKTHHFYKRIGELNRQCSSWLTGKTTRKKERPQNNFENVIQPQDVSIPITFSETAILKASINATFRSQSIRSG